MWPRYDIVILGGGPAGAATAIELRKHLPQCSVAIIERSAYEQPRIGETLPPVVQPLLAQLGVWESFLADKHLPAYGACSAWGSEGLQCHEFIYGQYGCGWHLDRRRFDAMLAREAEKYGAHLFMRSRVLDTQQTRDGWRLAMDQGNARMTVEAAFMVDATGRCAAFAVKHGAKPIRYDQLVGAFVFLKCAELHDTYTMVEANIDGWWYSALLPDSGMVAAWMSDADILKKSQSAHPSRWFDQLLKSSHTRRRVSPAEPITPPVLQAACSQQLNHVTGDSWLAVGDAAATFDPLSSQGILKALRTGMLASYAIADWFRGDSSGLTKYRLLIDREFHGYVKTHAEFYGQERRWAASPFWRRRHASLSPVPM